MEDFKDYFNRAMDRRVTSSTGPSQTKIQRGAVGIGRLNQRLVPDSAREDMSNVSKVEALRGSNSTREVPVSHIEARQIMSKYNIKNINNDAGRELGTTGIKLYLNINTNSFMLKRVTDE
jgi:hypothetical protein